MLTPDTRERLWGLAAQAGLEITSLDTPAERDAALTTFTSMLTREVESGLLNKRFAQEVLSLLKTGTPS